MNCYTLIGPFTQLVGMTNLPLKGPIPDDALTITNHAGLLLKDDHIYAIGVFEKLLQQAKQLNATVIELQHDTICLPGFIDAHTHICYGGSRSRDYAMRNAGKTYLEIAKAGGGIWDTVTHTRAANQQELMDKLISRAIRHLHSGITTIEIKSGYGLSVVEELKMLRAIKEAKTHVATDLIPTCLAAHILPKDFTGSHTDYLKQISDQLFPILKSEQLATRIDAFVEELAFSPDLIIPYFQQAKLYGFDVTVHADQFTTGGSQVAVHVGALSADHLEASTIREIEMLAKSNVIAMALPGASIGLGCAFAPARKLLDAGAALAIASDWNPGSAPMGDLLMQAAVLGTFEKLTNAEVLAGITFRAAAALGLSDRGVLTPGYIADFSIFETNHINEILYYQGKLLPAAVWRHGKEVHRVDLR